MWVNSTSRKKMRWSPRNESKRVEKRVTSQVLRGKPQPKRYFNASACTIDRRKMLICWYSSKHIEHAFRKMKARVSFALQLSLNTSATTKLRLNSMDLATLRRTTFYISLSRGSAIGTLLNIALLAYASDEKLYPAHANFPESCLRQSPCWGKGLNAVIPKYQL